jgi:CheY-like chemotaxis protein
METSIPCSNASGPVAGRVLVVDDNRPSAMTLGWFMQLNGYDVQTCFDGRSAAEVAHGFHPDVVLLDLGMPEVDGFEVCRRLREDGSLGKLTVIAQTGWGSSEMRQRTAQAGFNHHMTKPVDLTKLLEIIAASVN